MRTIEVAILSEQDETLVMDVLRAFEQQNRVSLRERNAAYLPGPPFSEVEFDQLIEKAEQSRPYSYEEAKSVLRLMTIEGREVIWNEQFLTSVAAIQQYISESNPVRGRTFASDVLDYTLEIIAPNPFAFVRFDHPKYQAMPYRRAVFRKNHIILYKVEDTRLTFLEIYHTSRNIDGIVPEPQ